MGVGSRRNVAGGGGVRPPSRMVPRQNRVARRYVPPQMLDEHAKYTLRVRVMALGNGP